MTYAVYIIYSATLSLVFLFCYRNVEEEIKKITRNSLVLESGDRITFVELKIVRQAVTIRFITLE